MIDDDANKLLHSCDLCSVMILEDITEPAGVIRPGRLLPDSSRDDSLAVWVCDQCEESGGER